MRFILFLILSAGATIGLYYAGLAYEEQSEEFISFQQDCAPKRVIQDKLKSEITSIQKRQAEIDGEYASKLTQVAQQLEKTSSLNPEDAFALSLLKKDDLDSRTTAIKQRTEAIDAHINLSRQQCNKTIQKNEDAINNNNQRLDSSLIAERNRIGKYYSENPNLGRELAARNAMEAKMSQLKKNVDEKNEQILKANLNIKKKFEEAEQKGINEKASLDQLLTEISEAEFKQNGLFSSKFYRKLLAKNPAFAQLNQNYDQAVKKLEDARDKKHDEYQSIVTEIESHPYTVLQKNSIHGIRSLVIMILVGLDAILITILYFALLRRNSVSTM